MSSPSKVRFAVVGAGLIGDVHAQAIRRLPDLAVLSLVVSRRAATARRLAEGRGARGYSTDYEAVLADHDIDAVSICTPTGSHAELAVAALRAGKHVMIEKPIEVSLGAADRIIAAERASGKTVAVVSQHRFDRSAERSSRPSGRATSGVWSPGPRPLPGGGGNRITTQDGGGGPGRVTVAGRS
jgi:UDP-N-acetyl-2-amino-2-deoxyglucuronate dehydrogenase